ncbi:uncharacterized protein LOC142980590 [Anticarsia gemmatalis]|uniref:uncharacterized protein LOC142980590 n=1 Tax=Anticarsia gemmatalis TaxID=129554 RepID=UPI003F764320
MSPYKMLFSVTILLSMVYKCSGIYCFYCNSANNSACLDPMQFDDETRALIIPVIDCDIAVPRVENIDFFCRKIVQTIFHPHRDSELRVTRGCGWIRDPNNRPCYRADNRDHLETVCQCFTNHCNSADGLNTTTALFLVLAVCLYLYR